MIISTPDNIDDNPLLCYLDEIIIEGQTISGIKFRPSDWVDRLCCLLADFKQKKMEYSPYLRPLIFREIQCIAVKKSLEQIAPEVFNYIMQFAKDNQLIVTNCSDFKQRIKQL